MNSFFGYSVVEKLKFITFDNNQQISVNDNDERKNVTIRKYKNKIKNIKNDKIKKSLIELTKVFINK